VGQLSTTPPGTGSPPHAPARDHSGRPGVHSGHIAVDDVFNGSIPLPPGQRVHGVPVRWSSWSKRASLAILHIHDGVAKWHLASEGHHQHSFASDAARSLTWTYRCSIPGARAPRNATVSMRFFSLRDHRPVPRLLRRQLSGRMSAHSETVVLMGHGTRDPDGVSHFVHLRDAIRGAAPERNHQGRFSRVRWPANTLP